MATPPTHEPGTILDHVKELGSIVLPLLGIIGALIVYAWQQMAGNLLRVERTLQTHIDTDTSEHKELSKLLREQSEELGDLETKVAKLQGEHEIYHKGTK